MPVVLLILIALGTFADEHDRLPAVSRHHIPRAITLRVRHVCDENCTPSDGHTIACREVVRRTPGGSTVSVLHLADRS